MAQEQHCDVIDTSVAPRIIPGLNRISTARSMHRPFDSAPLIAILSNMRQAIRRLDRSRMRPRFCLAHPGFSSQ